MREIKPGKYRHFKGFIIKYFALQSIQKPAKSWLFIKLNMASGGFTRDLMKCLLLRLTAKSILMLNKNTGLRR